jgi:hypothetical protein
VTGAIGEGNMIVLTVSPWKFQDVDAPFEHEGAIINDDDIRNSGAKLEAKYNGLGFCVGEDKYLNCML